MTKVVENVNLSICDRLANRPSIFDFLGRALVTGHVNGSFGWPVEIVQLCRHLFHTPSGQLWAEGLTAAYHPAHTLALLRRASFQESRQHGRHKMQCAHLLL